MHSTIVPVMAIAGSLVLRFVFVYAGQDSHWIWAERLLGARQDAAPAVVERLEEDRGRRPRPLVESGI